MAKNIKLSATRIQTFLRCKQKYWFMYHERLPKVDNPAFKLGIAVHEALEFAGAIWLKKEKFTAADTKKVLQFYEETAVREGLEDYSVHLEGKELVKKRLKSFTAGRKVIGLETKFGWWGPDGGKNVTTRDGVPLMGAIDKLEEYDDDTLLIVDYKTSKTAPTTDQLRTDVQLSIYDLVAYKLFPQYNRRILALDMLKSEAVLTYRTDEEREEFEAYLKVIYDQMLALKPEDVKASLNTFCPWCDFRDYCTNYQKACKKTDYEFLPVMNYTDEQLVQEWNSVKATKKILDMRDRELSMILMEKIQRNAANVDAGEEEVYIRQNARTTYDVNTVHAAVPEEDFPNLVNLNKKAVETYVSYNPAVKEEVAKAATVNYTTPFLATKKKKKTQGEG
jgi:RecB family exonuclease